MRTGRYSPLRYPGGKGKIASLVKAVIEANNLSDGTYVEPFAGGAGVACELLAENYVRTVHINDVSPAIYSFWRSALERNDQFCEAIVDVPLSVEEWDRQKTIFEEERRKTRPDLFALGFSTFFLNRTNRSGILNAGIIGGRAQSSEWGIDARFNRNDLIQRLRLLGGLRTRIRVTNLDALALLAGYRKNTASKRVLLYADPPYYAKGRQLYLDYYSASDHRAIAESIQMEQQNFRWLVSYDNVKPIKELYTTAEAIEYDINYSARAAAVGSEVIFFDPRLTLPDLATYIRVTKAA